MKAYEFQAKVMPDGKLDVPGALKEKLLHEPTVRVIVLINEPTDTYEQEAWSRLTAEQFFAGYSEADAIYNKLS